MISNMKMRWLHYVCVLFVGSLVVLGLSTPSLAESPASPASVLERIQKESKEFEQLRSALTSPAESVRVAAFNAMIESGNLSLRELAITTAFASDDEALRSLAIRAAFSSVQVITVTLITSEKPSYQEKRDVTKARGSKSATVSSIKYDVKTGKFTGADASGQVSGTVITFQTRGCAGSLTNKKGTWEFQGKVRCGKSVFDGTYKLR